MTSRNTESRQRMESMPLFLDYITTARPRKERLTLEIKSTTNFYETVRKICLEEEEVTDPLLGPAGAGSPQAMMTGGTGDGEKNRPIGKTIVTED